MKFMAKTSMDTATMRDVMLAYRQGTLVEQVPVSGLDETPRGFGFSPIPGMDIFGASLYLIMSLAMLGFGIFACRKAMKDTNFAPNWSLKQPLVFT